MILDDDLYILIKLVNAKVDELDAAADLALTIRRLSSSRKRPLKYVERGVMHVNKARLHLVEVRDRLISAIGKNSCTSSHVMRDCLQSII